MRYPVALLLPWLVFFTMGKIFQGILCLILQLTVVGCLPASIWAVISVGSYNADKRTDRVECYKAGPATTGSRPATHLKSCRSRSGTDKRTGSYHAKKFITSIAPSSFRRKRKP
jgi:hypothetical protein